MDDMWAIYIVYGCEFAPPPRVFHVLRRGASFSMNRQIRIIRVGCRDLGLGLTSVTWHHYTYHLTYL